MHEREGARHMENAFATKSEYIFNYIKNKILSGEYSQGEMIVISQITKETGISAIPIREALSRLESEGMVSIEPHKSARVAVFDGKRIAEVIMVRGVLEGYASYLAATARNKGYLKRLRKANEAMKGFAKNNDSSSFIPANKAFHKEIFMNSGNKLLYDTISNLWDGGTWSSYIFRFYPEKMLESVEAHERILDAIEAGDATLARNLSELHKMSNLELYEKTANIFFGKRF